MNKDCVDGGALSCNPTGNPKLREHGIEAEPASVFYGSYTQMRSLIATKNSLFRAKNSLFECIGNLAPESRL